MADDSTGLHVIPAASLRRRAPGEPRTDQAKLEREFRTVSTFVEVWCRTHHAPPGGAPCAECGDLLTYVRVRLEKCPYDPKPKCKACPTHCYKPDQRARVREIMRYSGMYFVKRGRLDWLVKYFMS
ncbi:MAG: nitrous oxide-stimulated promoter family protein [Acidobacteriota bacterium]